LKAATVLGVTVDHRAATAARNLEAILDAAERLLESGVEPSVASVAKEAGLSRVTVYAHFKTLDDVLEAVVARTVEQSVALYETARIDEGPAGEALQRVVSLSWRQIERHAAIAAAASQRLNPDAMRRAHETARAPLLALVRRGRAEGAFRDDLPEQWLFSATHALLHAAAEETRHGALNADEAEDALQRTISDLYAAR